jgi:hypothetical protein
MRAEQVFASLFARYLALQRESSAPILQAILQRGWTAVFLKGVGRPSSALGWSASAARVTAAGLGGAALCLGLFAPCRSGTQAFSRTRLQVFIMQRPAPDSEVSEVHVQMFHRDEYA